MGSPKIPSQAPTVVPTRSTLTADSVSAPMASQAPVTSVVNPAQPRDVGADTNKAVQNQQLARSRLQGIRSTWASFNDRNNTGTSSKLG